MRKLILAILLGTSLPATAQQAGHFPIGEVGLLPGGVAAFCTREPNSLQCESESDGVRSVPYSEEVLSQLRSVNDRVNDITTYLNDRAKFGEDNHWSLPTGHTGDCKAYALLKMNMLVAKGWPRGALDIAIGMAGHEGHAVLVAHTDKADYVLDEIDSKVKVWSDVPYRWLEMSQGGDFHTWVVIVPPV